MFLISSFALIMLDIGTKGRGGIGVFIGVCLISALFGTADAHVQGGLVGDLSFMCPEFIQSFLAGLAASGALTSALRLITKAAFENSQNGLRNGAILFFSITCIFELVCLLLYAYVFPKLPIVKYYRSKAASEGSKTVAGDLAAAGVKTEQDRQVEEDPQKHERLSTEELLMQNIDYAFDIYLICPDSVNLPWIFIRRHWITQPGNMVHACADSDVQRWGSGWEVPATDQMPEADLSEGPNGRDPGLFMNLFMT